MKCTYNTPASLNILYIYTFLQSKLKDVAIYIPLFFLQLKCLLNDIIPQIYGTALYSAPLVGDLLSVCTITASYRAIYNKEHNYSWRMWRNTRTYTPGMSGSVTKGGLNIDLWCRRLSTCDWWRGRF